MALRKALRLLQRGGPIAVALAVLAALGLGALSKLETFTFVHGLILAALACALCFLGWRRMRLAAQGRTISLREELEFGGLLILAGFALAQPAGGVESPIFPLVYLLLAFLVPFLPGKAAIALTSFAVVIDVSVFALSGALPERWGLLAAQSAFLVLFAALHRITLGTQVLSGKATGELAIKARVQEVEDRAREYRLLAAGIEGEEIDQERWVTAAVKEVEEAVGNALEVAECALRTHTVAVFLVLGDDKLLKLHDCRSNSDDVMRAAFDAREGILGAALKRKMPMRLCGELKGVTWYDGRTLPKSVLAVPLLDRRGAALAGRDDGYLRGLLVADRLEATPFTEEDERLLSATSREVLRAIEIERVMGYIRKARDEKDQFYRSIEELNQASKPGEVVNTTLHVVQHVVKADFVAFTTRHENEENGRRFHRVEGVAGVGQALVGYEFPDNAGLVANVVRYGATLPGRELRAMERPVIFDEASQVKGLQALRILPLRSGEEILGTLVCGSKRKGSLDADATRMLEVIGIQAAQSLQRARLFEQTERMATTDGLTGLINHRSFQAKFDEELARAARSGRKVALLLTDIDHFKSVNDTYGHATGDAVLKGVAKILQRCARTTDIVARYGGEEFAIVLPETDMAGGKIIAERIREAVQSHEFQTELGPLRCTLSLGIAAYPDVSTVKQELFEKADQCLYHCKRMGRNRSTTVDEMSYEARLRAVGEG